MSVASLQQAALPAWKAALGAGPYSGNSAYVSASMSLPRSGMTGLVTCTEPHENLLVACCMHAGGRGRMISTMLLVCHVCAGRTFPVFLSAC